MSLPAWERGLKQYLTEDANLIDGSLPAWERGLKHHLPERSSQSHGRSLRGSVD